MKKIYLTEIILLTKSYNLQDFKDWLKWHLDILHFDHIVVFDNESEVDIKSECEKDKRIEYHLIQGWPDQYNLYNRYINNESKSWWVLPIDDDEFLYISEKYNHDVDTMILELQDKWNDMNKFSVCWVNMFSPTFIETRDKSLLDTCTSYSYEICKKLNRIWRQDNSWVKTFTKTTKKWWWAFDDKNMGVNSGHNPTLQNNEKSKSYLINGDILINEQPKTHKEFINTDCFLAHFQYKSNEEWCNKCKNRKSAGSHVGFNKNKPEVYKKIYENINEIKNFDKLKILWNKSI